MYIERAVDRLIRRAIRSKGVVLVTGARQVGKSTSLEKVLPGRRYVTLDDPFLEEQAKGDSRTFMEVNPPPVTIDEVQHAPILFRYIKQECDRRKGGKGLYCLSGSQPFHLMKGVSESLAGRVRILEMGGLSLREITGDGCEKHFLPTESFVVGRARAVKGRRPSVWETIHRGSYPELQDGKVVWSEYYSDYVKTYLERDVRALTAVQDLGAFRQFMVAAASRTAQVLNYSNIADEIGKDVGTVRKWVSILEASGLVYLLQPYAATELKRAIKAPKLHFRDAGLVAYLTRWLSGEQLSCGAMAGPIFESFVVSEILKSYSNEGLDYRDFVSYYRGRDKRKVRRNGETVVEDGEIDLIIEENGVLYPIEVKKTSSPKAIDADCFQVLDAVSGKRRGSGAIVCNCATPVHLRDNLLAVPVGCI